MQRGVLKKCICFIFVVEIFSFGSVPAFAADTPDADAGDEFAGRFLANYITTLYNTGSNDFPSDEGNTVLQTRDGYLWFGGYSGLTRYDGKKYTVWNAVSKDGFTSSNVRALCEGEDGTLWIGTNDKGLVAYKNGTFTTYDKTDGVPSNLIRCITEGADGRIYCGTPDGLFYIDRERKITTVEFDTDVHPFVISVSRDVQDNIYAAFNSGEFFVCSAEGVTTRYPFDLRIGAAACVSGGRVVAGTQGAVIITEFNGKAFTRHEVKSTPLFNVTSVYEDSRGYIWITSETGVGFLDTDENYHNLGNPNGIGFYTDICEDYQNGYWITGTKGGVVKLTVSAFSDLNALYNFERGAVNAIVMDGETTYIGMDNGLYALDGEGNQVLMDFTGPIRSRTRGIFRDSVGNIWVCTYADFGVIRYTPSTNTYKSWLPADGLASDRTRCMAELPNGVIVIGSGGGVNFIKGDTIISANEAFETDRELTLPTITVLSMVCATDGTLYIGTDGSGIYAVNKDGTTRYQEEDGLPGGVVLRMLANPKTNGVWVAAAPGLSYIDGSQKVTVINKVPPYSFLDIQQLNDDLILLTSSLIIRTDADALLDPAVPFEHTAVDKSSGLTASINANSWNVLTQDGILYFCCAAGISKYSFQNKTVPFIPYAGITKISVDNAAYTDFSKNIVMSRDSDRLTIELSYLSFGLLDRAALYYQLEGQDSVKHSLSKNDNLNISYTNLKGGKYTLCVWTEDSGGNRGNSFEIALQKELKWFEYARFWIIITAIAVLLVTLLVIVIVRYNARKAHQKQREYRTIITQALTAIANTIDAKDAYTSGHSARVAAYSAEIARRLGLGRDFVENIYYISLLHDVGKIGIPSEIINKPDKLTNEEYAIMKNHPTIGQHILKDITTINNLTAGAAEHHERWDGKGYNRGIFGEDISLEARIIAVADTYDAMSSDRSYRKGLSRNVILDELKRCKGNQFDPEIADIAINMLEHGYFESIDVDKIIDTIRADQ